jgi:hypothetical protein
MKREEAVKEAQKRYGFYGWVKSFSDATFSVGQEFTTLGEGTSFDAAFADADKRNP